MNQKTSENKNDKPNPSCKENKSQKDNTNLASSTPTYSIKYEFQARGKKHEHGVDTK